MGEKLKSLLFVGAGALVGSTSTIFLLKLLRRMANRVPEKAIALKGIELGTTLGDNMLEDGKHGVDSANILADEIVSEQLTRNIQFFGFDAQQKVTASYVVIIGLGGVGSHAASMLLRSGIGRLLLVDFDQVSLASLNRHAVATRADVGIPKAECLRKHFASIFPECQIEVKVLLYDTSSEEEILSGNPDYVLDCIDNIDTKVALLAACVRRGVKVLSATGAGARADPTRIRVADLRESTNDPLSRAVRYRLKKDHGIERGIPVVFSLEKPKVKLLPFKGPTGEDENPSDYQVKVIKRLTESVLSERIKKLDDQQADGIFCGSRPIATPSERLKASRARKLLQKKVALKEEKKAAALAAGFDWCSEDENADSQEEPAKEPPLPNIVVDEEHHCLIIDLCKALASTQRYYEALKIIRLTLKCGNNTLPVEKKEQLRSLGAQMAYRTMDHKDGFDCARDIVLEHPHSIASWNCYYKVSSRLGRNYSKHLKFLRAMRAKHKDCVAPILITGHQFTSVSHHQDAAREYLEAYKLLPDNPLTNLCAGTALINLALGFRLQNKHQCVAQGLSFLFNNLRLCESSQEALYNIARAFHHVGLVSLAAFYYEKVLALREKDYPIPKLPNEDWDVAENQKHGYCDLRREAAFNLHLIYKTSGSVDLARQVLRDHCTFD